MTSTLLFLKTVHFAYSPVAISNLSTSKVNLNDIRPFVIENSLFMCQGTKSFLKMLQKSGIGRH